MRAIFIRVLFMASLAVSTVSAVDPIAWMQDVMLCGALAPKYVHAMNAYKYVDSALVVRALYHLEQDLNETQWHLEQDLNETQWHLEQDLNETQWQLADEYDYYVGKILRDALAPESDPEVVRDAFTRFAQCALYYIGVDPTKAYHRLFVGDALPDDSILAELLLRRGANLVDEPIPWMDETILCGTSAPEAVKIMKTHSKYPDYQPLDLSLEELWLYLGSWKPNFVGGVTPISFALIETLDPGSGEETIRASFRQLMVCALDDFPEHLQSMLHLFRPVPGSELAELLLNAGADPTVPRTGDTYTILEAASQLGSSQVIKLFIEHGVDPTSDNSILYALNPETLQALVEHGVNPDEVRRVPLPRLGGFIDTTPLFEAARQGHSDIVRALVELGVRDSREELDVTVRQLLRSRIGEGPEVDKRIQDIDGEMRFAWNKAQRDMRGIHSGWQSNEFSNDLEIIRILDAADAQDQL